LLKFSDKRQTILENVDSSSQFTLERREQWGSSEDVYGDNKSTRFPSVYVAQAEFKLTLSNEDHGFQLLYDLLIENQLLAHIESCRLQLITSPSTSPLVSLVCNAQIFDFDWHASDSWVRKSDARVVRSQQPQKDKVFLQPNRRLLGRRFLKSEPELTQTVSSPLVNPVENSDNRKKKNEQSLNTAKILSQTYHRSESVGSLLPLNNGQRPDYFLGQRVTRIWHNQIRKEGVK